VRSALLAALAFGAACVALAFLALPVVAIFTRVPPGRLVRLLSSGVVTDALVVSAKTTLIAEALILLFGTPLAYLLATLWLIAFVVWLRAGRARPDRGLAIATIAGAAIFVAGSAPNLEEGIAKAGEAIDSGAARTVLERYVEISRA